VGFNTKNTFTRAFKRHTGKTPSQFKVDETNNSISLDHN
jgi:AraC-like DNA-binding protein